MTANEPSRSPVIVDIAETALRYWGGADLSREKATVLLPTWRHADVLSDVERAEVLDRFEPKRDPLRWRDADGDIWQESVRGRARMVQRDGRLGARAYALTDVAEMNGPLTLVPREMPALTPANHAELDALPTVEQAVALGQAATTVAELGEQCGTCESTGHNCLAHRDLARAAEAASTTAGA